MKQPRSKPRLTEQARVGIIIFVLVSFVLGLAAGAFWHFQKRNTGEVGKQRHELSDATKAVLKGLNSSVEIRFYSLLDPTSVSDSLQAFAGRVYQLLVEYQNDANGRIAVKNFKSISTDADAALADSIQPFNFDKGDACFLGIVITCGDRKELFNRLSSEWEVALESDLTRAISRVASPKSLVSAPQAESPINARSLEEVKRFFPNLAEVSLEDGTRMLREAALPEFQTAMKEAEGRIAEANQRLMQANNGGSESERQGALKQLQKVQAEQTEKLSKIAAHVQAQITALEYLKRN